MNGYAHVTPSIDSGGGASWHRAPKYVPTCCQGSFVPKPSALVPRDHNKFLPTNSNKFAKLKNVDRPPNL